MLLRPRTALYVREPSLFAFEIRTCLCTRTVPTVRAAAVSIHVVDILGKEGLTIFVLVLNLCHVLLCHSLEEKGGGGRSDGRNTATEARKNLHLSNIP